MLFQVLEGLPVRDAHAVFEPGGIHIGCSHGAADDERLRCRGYSHGGLGGVSCDNAPDTVSVRVVVQPAAQAVQVIHQHPVYFLRARDDGHEAGSHFFKRVSLYDGGANAKSRRGDGGFGRVGFVRLLFSRRSFRSRVIR